MLRFAPICILLCLVLISSVSKASVLSFTVDPTQSVISVTSIVDGTPLVPQLPGSDSDAIGGTILADVEPRLDFVSRWQQRRLRRPSRGAFLPDGTPGNVAGELPGTLFAMISDAVIDVTNTAQPVVGGNFTADYTVALTAGTLSFTGLPPTSIAGNSAPNDATAVGTLVQNGNQLVLTFATVNLGSVDLLRPPRSRASFVAVAMVPEPNRVVLLCSGLVVGGAWFSGAIRRRRAPV